MSNQKRIISTTKEYILSLSDDSFSTVAYVKKYKKDILSMSNHGLKSRYIYGVLSLNDRHFIRRNKKTVMNLISGIINEKKKKFTC